MTAPADDPYATLVTDLRALARAASAARKHAKGFTQGRSQLAAGLGAQAMTKAERLRDALNKQAHTAAEILTLLDRAQDHQDRYDQVQRTG